MESWRKVWRNGVVPLVTVPQLQKLANALEHDFSSLIQGATTLPPPLQSYADWPCQGCCGLSYLGWNEERTTVAEVEEFFARLCFDVDKRLGESAACRYFLNWFDETPQDEMRIKLAEEIRYNICYVGMVDPATTSA
jgi:hypothetical protein